MTDILRFDGLSSIEGVAHVLAFTDGSYSTQVNRYVGSGIFLIFLDENYSILKMLATYKNLTISTDIGLSSMHQVGGELSAVLDVTRLAIKENFPDLRIYYDYTGVEKWATDEWKAKNSYTKQYKDSMQAMMKKLVNRMAFIKVKAHSGDFYNEVVDELAKTGSGINTYQKLTEILCKKFAFCHIATEIYNIESLGLTFFNIDEQKVVE